MKGSISSIVGTLLSVFVVTQAEVLVTIFDGGGDVACGQKVTLMCEVRSDTGIMTWEIGGTAVALCTLGTCDTDSTTFPDISFSFDTDSDVYNITIDPIAISYNGIRVKCDDGESFNSQTLSVTVPPSADTSFIESSSNHTRTLISVSTGCITNRENINVTWFYYKASISGPLCLTAFIILFFVFL